MADLPLRRIVLYKHGVGHFEREGSVKDEATLSLTFRQAEVSDVLKSLTVLDLDGGHIASVSYDSTKPLEQLLAEVALEIPDHGSLQGFLSQIKGAQIALESDHRVEGTLLGIDTFEKQTEDGITRQLMVSLLTEAGGVQSFDLLALKKLEILDETLQRDLEFYLRTQLSAKKKDSRTFTFFAQGEGERKVRLSYTIEAPVWKATYRIILREEENESPLIQGWAVVDNTQDEDWHDVQLSLVAGLPVSFIHDLYTPRYIKRPEVEVQETTGVLPPEVEEGMAGAAFAPAAAPEMSAYDVAGRVQKFQKKAYPSKGGRGGHAMSRETIQRSTPAQVRERKLGDLFEYEIEHPVTIRRNQSALVPIVLESFEGRSALLYNKQTREENPMRCVELKNTTGLTLEGGPLTVLEESTYVGEAMLETIKPDEEKLVPYAVELGVHVLDNIDSHEEKVHRVTIRQGQLRTSCVQIKKTTYTINNKSDEEMILWLEHERGGTGWTLMETPEPREITRSYWRFRFSIEPKKTTQFVVQQKSTQQQTYALQSFDVNTLLVWIDQKHLDDKTIKVLQKITELRQQEAGHLQKVEQAQQETGSIHNDQVRIQGNLKSLGSRTSEKELTDRLVKTLNSQEDRLQELTQEIQTNGDEATRIREQISAMIAELDYDSDK